MQLRDREKRERERERERESQREGGARTGQRPCYGRNEATIPIARTHTRNRSPSLARARARSGTVWRETCAAEAFPTAVGQVCGKPRDDSEKVERSVINKNVELRALGVVYVVVADDPDLRAERCDKVTHDRSQLGRSTRDREIQRQRDSERAHARER